MGLLYKLQGKLEEAEPRILRALEARERTLGKEHRDTLETVIVVGGLYRPRAVMARPSRI